MDATLSIILTVCSSLGVGGIISGIVIWKLQKMEEAQKQRDDSRIQESCLIFEGVRVSGHLSEETALAIKGKSKNGELDEALEEHKAYMKRLSAYLEKQTATANHG